MTAPAAVFAAALAWGSIYGLFARHMRPGWRKAAAKTVAVALLALAAILAGLPPLLVAALALSAAGDWFLAFEGEKAFLGGLGSFAAAHLAYAALFSASQDEVWSASPLFLAGAIAILAYAAGMFARLRPHLGPMRIPAAIYTGLIAAMAVAAWSQGPHPLLLAGVALFMVSDTILAFETFVIDRQSPRRRWTGPAIWYFYLGAQALIFLAVAFGALLPVAR